jgi:hypothetical protein
MASYNPLKCGVTLRLNGGTDPITGKTTVRNVTLSKILPSATADQIDALADALAPLVAYPVLDVRRTGTDEVVA